MHDRVVGLSRSWGWLAVLGAVILAWGTPTAWAQIQWQSGTSALSGKTHAEAVETIVSAGLRGADRHVVVQFDEPMTPARRAELQAAGVELLTYLGNHAFFASVGPEGANAAALGRVASLTDAQPIQLDWKLHPYLVQDIVVEWAIVDPGTPVPDGEPSDPVVGAYIVFHPDVDLDAEGKTTVWRYGAWIRSELRSINGLVIELPMSMIKPLAAEDVVQWIEPPLPKMSEVNNSNRARTGADIVQAPPYGLSGSGVTVLVYDAGTVYAAHQDFGGRVQVRDSSGELYHATHVAGTVGGSGAQSGGTYKGMAPGVIIESYGFEQVGGLHEGFLYTDPGDLEADYSQAINTYGADVSNNSIGTNTAANGFPCDWEGNYGATSQLIDTIVRGDGSNPLFPAPFRVVWANGNERSSGRCGTTYHTTAPPACAKNHITVGALNSNDDSITYFTSWGPTDDDRLKPDISAPGCQSNDDNGVTSTNTGGGYTTLCGTSMASPTVCGLSALLLQDFRAQFPGRPDFRNSTLKVLLAHTAVDRGNVGPDYQFGYGSVRIQPAIDLMHTGTFYERDTNAGESNAAFVVVAPGDPELKVTLAWDDVPGPPNAVPELVNDLDLRVYGPSGIRYYPWTLGGLANPSAPAVRTQEDHVNNIEQVVVDNPQPGTWSIEVYGYNVPVGPQPYSLVGEDLVELGVFISFPDGLPELIAPGVPTSINVRIAVTGQDYVEGSGTFHYRYDGGTWQTAPLVPLGGELYQATFPAPNCDDTPEYYFSAAGTATGVVTKPGDAPTTVYTAQVATLTTFIRDNGETDQGWTVENIQLSSGAWGRGVPAGDGSRGDPTEDFDGSGQCWLTDNRIGNSDVDGGPTRLVSRTFDMHRTADPIFEYARWFRNDDLDQDRLTVEISNDNGQSWTLIESVPDTVGWVARTLHLTDYITLTSQMKVRFSAVDNPNNSKTEAGIDAVDLFDIACVPPLTGDFDADGDVDLGDYATFHDCLTGPGGGILPGCAPADLDTDVDVDLGDFTAFQAAFTVP
ncbi:MAG: S8 family serine peptidase [Planctomycetota bacterium]